MARDQGPAAFPKGSPATPRSARNLPQRYHGAAHLAHPQGRRAEPPALTTNTPTRQRPGHLQGLRPGLRAYRHQASPSAAIPPAARLEPWAAPPKLQTANGERRKRYLYVAIDRRSRSVPLAVKDDETEASAIAFLREAAAAFPFRMTHVLTDNGSCFTQAFAKVCAVRWYP